MTSRTNEQSAAAPAGNNGFTLISNEKLLQLYTTMLKCRMIEERARALFSQGGFAGNDFTSLTSVGQEATVVAVAIDLLPEDTIASSQGELIAAFHKSKPMKKALASAAQLDVAVQLDLVLSNARLNKDKKNGKIAVVFIDGSAIKLACWRQAIHAAGEQQLPILFVCQSKLVNGQAKAAEAKIPVEAEASGLPGIIVDGNDVVAVYRVATESIAHARKGSGATLIHCLVDRTKANDPILKMEHYLQRKGLYNERLRLKADKILRGSMQSSTAPNQ